MVGDRGRKPTLNMDNIVKFLYNTITCVHVTVDSTFEKVFANNVGIYWCFYMFLTGFSVQYKTNEYVSVLRNVLHKVSR